MNQLNFIEIVILMCIVKYHDAHQKPPSQRELLRAENGEHTGLINGLLESEGVLGLPLEIRAQYSDMLKSMDTLRRSLTNLEKADLLVKGRGGFSPTDRGVVLIRKVSRDPLLECPVVLRIDKNLNFMSGTIYPKRTT